MEAAQADTDVTGPEPTREELEADWRSLITEAEHEAVRAWKESESRGEMAVRLAWAMANKPEAKKFASEVLDRIASFAKRFVRHEDLKDNNKDKNKQPERESPPPAPPPHTKTREEPKDISTLPLLQQRQWLVKRFRRLDPNASFEEVRTEWKRLVKIHHPDRGGSEAN